MSGIVECGKHGSSRPAFVCTHLVQTLRDGVARGLIWSRDDDGNVNAYCDGCDSLLASSGDWWTDEIEDEMQVSLMCEVCFTAIQRINGAAGLDS